MIGPCKERVNSNHNDGHMAIIYTRIILNNIFGSLLFIFLIFIIRHIKTKTEQRYDIQVHILLVQYKMSAILYHPSAA